MAITTRWRMPPDSSCGYCRRRRSGSGMPTDRSSATAVSGPRSRSRSVWTSSDSVICLPMRITGLSDVIGSWNTIDICVPQYDRSAASSRPSMRSPSNDDLARAHGRGWAAGP